MSADSSLTYSLMSSLSLYSHNVPNKNNNNNELLNRQYNTPKKRSIWSEGLERNIDTIVLGKYDNSKPHQKLVAEMKILGKTLGFNVAESDVKESGWIEDIGIRRADGKVYVLPKMGNCSDIKTGQDVEFNSAVSLNFAKKFNQRKIIKGKSYLEGGNVLNTILKNGEAGAVIGTASIDYSLRAMHLKDTPQNRSIVKAQIAKDLGLKFKNVSFIQQYDFHIDMFYRPLKNGEIAVPDYLEAIKVLKNTKISGMDKHSKLLLMKQLKKAHDRNAESIRNAERELTKSGYKLVKIPCFSLPTNMCDNTGINYANGVCGKDKNGKLYIITNKSNYKELDAQIIKYYKKAGVNNVYFVSTQQYLKSNGGLDCRTQEF